MSRTYTTTHTVYQFDELEPAAQEKALDNLRDINTDGPYWYYDEGLEELAAEYGVTLKWTDLCFDLERGSYVYLDTHDHGSKAESSHISNDKKYLKACGLDLRSKVVREWLADGLSLECEHLGGGYGRNYVTTPYDQDDRLQTGIKELADKLLEYLRDQYEWHTSDEAVRETIDANEYEFTKDGELA